MKRAFALISSMGAALPIAAEAHSFGNLYNLPIPLWMYLYSSAAALLLSFLVIGYFVTEETATRNFRSSVFELRSNNAKTFLRVTTHALKAVSFGSLVLIIVSGAIGVNVSYYNINMTLFWVAFVLGFTYVTAIFGDLYRYINPWKLVTDWTIDWKWTRRWSGLVRYPASLSSYPALIFYMSFIGLELFSHMAPRLLSGALAGYTIITLVGAWVIGRDAWFRHCDFFGVYFRCVGLCSPIVISRNGSGVLPYVRVRQPFIGLVSNHARDLSHVLFVLFMLSSTAFDGFHETAPWVNGFWVQMYQALTPYIGTNIVDTYPIFKVLYLSYQAAGLLLSPLLYFLIYMSSLAAVKMLTATKLSLRELALRFAYSLIPIALVYNISHYFTLIVSQGLQLIRLVSDPLGFGWNLFGTAHWQLFYILDAGFVWHAQVALILIGHLFSVYLAHLEAVSLFGDRKTILVSQLPMLLLMVAYTCIGLWVLSLPITNPPMQG